MARYVVVITFNNQPANLNELVMVTDQGPWLWKFVTATPVNPGDTPIGPYELATAANFYGVTQIDYNAVGRWIVALNGIEVTITVDSSIAVTVPTNTGGMDIVITETADVLAITSLATQESASNQCNVVDLLIGTNKDFNEVISPIPDTFADTSSYLMVGLGRSLTTTLRIKNSLSEEVIRTITTPSHLNEGKLSVQAAGGSVFINDTTTGLVLEYSLDNITFKPENSFNGLSAGDYTCYVKDDFGCATSIDFTVLATEDGEVVVPEPYFHYSGANCIRMAYREQWDDVGILKNDYNTLSCESTDRVVHIEKQRFRTGDTINLQVKSNYADLEIKTSEDDVLTLVQKSSNLNNKEALDCSVIKLTDTTVGVYFVAGDTYDYDTLIVNGTHTLNGELPTWGTVGNIITIGAFNYVILEVSFNEDVQKKQLVISAALSTGDYVVKAIFHVFPYELYEVALPLLGMSDPFNIEIYYGGQTRYVSELIYPDDYTLNLLKIQYYMDYNTDMFFATGIQPMLRLQQDLNNAASNREQESYNTDETTTQINVKNYRMNVFRFLPVTKQLARNCMEIFSSSNININGVDYRCDSINMEPQEESNLYVLTAKMEEKNSGLFRDQTGSSEVTLPNLITTDNGYVKI